MMMRDFSRSFVTCLSAGNNPRFQVEAICDLTEDGETTRYVLAASCKGEDTFVETTLLRVPAYDFCVVFSEMEHQVVRQFLPLGGAWLQPLANTESWDRVRIDLAEYPAHECSNAQEVVEATAANMPLVGVTELRDEDGQVCARLEYPLKCMNARRDPWEFQVDTGPIIVPDMERDVNLQVQRMDLAFVAWNRDGAVDFLILEPTLLDGLPVGHYSRLVETNAHNAILCPSEG